MYGLVDFRSTHAATTGGYFGLLALARQLVGEAFLFARRGYPAELKLHFGTPLQIPGPKGRALASGSYVLGAVASAWTFKIAGLGVTVYSGDPLTGTNPLPESKLDELLSQTGGLTVTGVEVSTHPFGYSVSVSLSDGSGLTIFPTPECSAPAHRDAEPSPVPDWELFTPYNRFLRVGPGSEWAYLPSDAPE